MGNVVIPYWGSGIQLEHEADRITNGVTGIHLYLNAGKRSSMTPEGTGVELDQISDLSGNFADVDIAPSGVETPLIVENQLNGESILQFDAGEGDDIDIGDNTHHTLLHDGSPFRLYSILNLHTTPASTLFNIATRAGADLNGFFLAIDPTTRFIRCTAREGGVGNLYSLVSGTGIALDTWNKIAFHYRGYNHATLNDAQIYLNGTSIGAIGTSNDRGDGGNSSFALGIQTVGSLEDCDYAMVLFVNDTGKSDSQVSNEDALIQDVISNLFAL